MKKLRMNKRGFEVTSQTAGKLIIIALTVVIIILIAVNLIFTLRSAGEFESCQKSIAIAHQQGGNILQNSHHLECKATPLIVTPDDADREATAMGKPGRPDEGLKNILAGEMVRCWRMVGKGEFDPYQGTWDLGVVADFCLICTTIDFAMWDDIRGGSVEEELQLSGFHEFLDEESATIEDSERLYKDFLPEGWDNEDDVHDTINLSKTYVVTWALDELGSGDSQHILLLPYDSMIENHCTAIAN